MDILFVIIGFGIVNTILMSVMLHHREFGVLQASGIALSLFLTWYFFADGLNFRVIMSEKMTFSSVVIDPIIIPLFRVARTVQALIFILLIGVVASIYPALRAVKIDVTEAMKFHR